jgi:hypothetical protein
MAREAKHDGSEWIVWIDPETGQERRASPSSNLTVAVVAAKIVPAGVPWRLMQSTPHGRSPAFYEPRIEIAQPVPVPIQVPADDSMARLAGYMALAVQALLQSVKAGDYRWHGGSADFEFGGHRMDAQELLAYGRNRLNGG